MLDYFARFYVEGGFYMHLVCLSAVAGLAFSGAALLRASDLRLWFVAMTFMPLTWLLGLGGTVHGIARAYEPVVGHVPETAQGMLAMMGAALSISMHPLLLAIWLVMFEIVALAAAGLFRWQAITSAARRTGAAEASS